MSIEAVAWALRQQIILADPKEPEREPASDATAKLVLIAIADHHNASTDECFPSMGRLSEVACCGKSTVIRKVQKLVWNGWISVLARYAKGGRQTSNGYTINFGKGRGVNLTPSPVSTREPRGCQVERPTSLNKEKELKKGDISVLKKERPALEVVPAAELSSEQRAEMARLLKQTAKRLRA